MNIPAGNEKKHVNLNIESRAHQLSGGTHKVSPSSMIKAWKKALLSEVESGSLVGELTCGEASIAA